MRVVIIISSLVVTVLLVAGCASMAPGERASMDASTLSGVASERSASGYADDSAMPADGEHGRRRKTDRYREDPQSGLLTAASWDDNRDRRPFRRMVREDAQTGGYGAVAECLFGDTIELRAVTPEGQAIPGAVFTVRENGQRTALKLLGRRDGRAVLHTTWDSLPDAGVLEVTAEVDGAVGRSRFRLDRRERVVTVTIDAPIRQAGTLDLAFVIDCTGSMSDELEYLKVELRDIAMTVKRRYPDVAQRYALIVYRDEGDDYECRTYDFTRSLARLITRIGKQSAGGGGDYPEALHVAMNEAEDLSWSDDAAARVMFLVADAPPHQEHALRAVRSVDSLRRQGVAVYPVGASGVAEAAELCFRAMAKLTGARYLFLTDDSGVGNSHEEPRIPYYEVERLKSLMIRMIASEIEGRWLTPNPDDVLRVVGSGRQRNDGQRRRR